MNDEWHNNNQLLTKKAFKHAFCAKLRTVSIYNHFIYSHLNMYQNQVLKSY